MRRFYKASENKVQKKCPQEQKIEKIRDAFTR